MMIGKNIRYYRLLREMSQEALANSIGIGKMAISNYESGKRTPDYATSRKISKALDVSLAKLLAQNGETLVIKHGAFRKHSTVTKAQQEVILGKADRYLGRLFEVVSFVGDPALPSMPDFKPINVSDVEAAGQHLRSILGLPETGPIGNITDILENKGYIICPIEYDKRIFSGNSGTVNGRPYIAINSTMPAERQRFTLIHELAHLVLYLTVSKTKNVWSMQSPEPSCCPRLTLYVSSVQRGQISAEIYEISKENTVFQWLL